MGNEVLIGESESARLASHPLRTAVLAEVHARPFNPVSAPARVLRFGFQASASQLQADREHLTEFCQSRGLPSPLPQDKHHRVQLGGTTLRWEQHSEFTTYTWEMPFEQVPGPFYPMAGALASAMKLIPQPGPILVAIDLSIEREGGEENSSFAPFDQTSLALAETAEGSAVIATDFKPTPEGYLRILLIDRGMSRERTGSLAQHLLDIETYRTLALLGLPEAQRIAPAVDKAEKRLVEVTERMRKAGTLSDNHQMLDELTALAADVEASAAASQFRFSASRAYEEIVTQRLQIVGERKMPGFPTWSSFLSRRMTPAMRTCAALEARQSNLSLRLTRAANLLRTRVDVELEQQNQQLLKSMNTRTRLQLRLQTTVEGLSVAAITYYATALFDHLIEAAHHAGLWKYDTVYATAAFVPLAAATLWFTVSRIRRRHMSEFS
jgi:uncharacterized membrane-anchored protein